MSWVKRMPPGDPEYFCDCPPCPFCFVWATEGGTDRRGTKRHALAQPQRIALPVLASIGFLLTVDIAIRYENVSTRTNEQVPAPTSPLIQGHTPAAPTVSRPDQGTRATSSADRAVSTKSSSAAVPATESTQPEVPVSLLVNKLQDSSSARDGADVVLRNLSGEPLLVKITVSSESAANKFSAEVSLPAADLTELVELPASPGDRITLASLGYRDQIIYLN